MHSLVHDLLAGSESFSLRGLSLVDIDLKELRYLLSEGASVSPLVRTSNTSSSEIFAVYSFKPPYCTNTKCQSKLYTTKRLAWTKSSEKRTPCNILPYALLIRAIQRILLRRGKWKTSNDSHHSVRPNSLTCSMHGFYDGWAWRAIQAGLEQRKCGQWGIEDTNVRGAAQCFVSLPCGWVLVSNIDMYAQLSTH
jgi:hypothetical protein